MMLKTFGLIFALSTSIAYAQNGDGSSAVTEEWYTVNQGGCVSLSDASKGMPDLDAPWKLPSDLLKSALTHGMTLKAHRESPDDTTVLFEFVGHDDDPLDVALIKGRALCEHIVKIITDPDQQ